MDRQFAIVGLAATSMIAAVISGVAKAVPRGRRAPRVDDRLDQITRQLAELQTSVDATMIEVERLGEGLRFSAKLLAEQRRANE